MDELSKRRKWQRWLALIESEVQRLQDEHRTYTQLREHLSAHPQWVSWIDTLYLIGVSLAMRRLSDANQRHRTVSLVKLLKEMETHAECLSRRSALQGTDGVQRLAVHRLFDRIAGEGSSHIPQAVVRQWVEEFEQMVAPFRAWADHRIAHHDLSVHCPPPDIQRVEQVLDWLRAMLRILWLLIKKPPRRGEEV